MNRRQALALLAETDPMTAVERPVHDRDRAIAQITGFAPSAAVEITTVTPARRRRTIASPVLVTVVAALLVVVVGGVLLAVRQHHGPDTPAALGFAGFPVDIDKVLIDDITLLQVDLRVPGPDQRPHLTASQALEKCRAQGVGCDPLPDPISVALASATSDTPAKINPDGTTTKENDNRLVWAVTWRSECIDSGGPAYQVSDAPTARPTAVSYCDNLVLIDAHTGAMTIDTQGESSGP